MSDTTTTITAEEMARLRSILSERGNPQVEDRIILRLLNTAEQAEARVKSRNNHIHRLLGEALENERNLDGMKSRWQTAEAENAQLLAQIHALLECRKAEKALAALTRINDGIKGGWSKPWEHEGLPKKLRKARERVKIARQLLETTRRAVADSEVKA